MKRRGVESAEAFLAAMYPQLVAPTFEHSLFGATDISEENEASFDFGEHQFTPRYPCYREHHVLTDY